MKEVLDKANINNVQLISGFWLWLILILDNPQGVDLIDAFIKYLGA
jgi:hypothetical protein